MDLPDGAGFDDFAALSDVATWTEALTNALEEDVRLESLVIDSVDWRADVVLLAVRGMLEHAGTLREYWWTVTAVPDLRKFARLVKDWRGLKPIAPRWGPAIIVVPERSAVMIPFPNDARMPDLRVLGNAARLKTLLARTMLDRAVVPRDVDVTPLRYRPERRFVGRIDLPHLTAIVRARAGHAGGSVAELLHGLAEKFPFVPRLLGHDPERILFLEEFRSGVPITGAALDRFEAEALIEETGRRLSAVHQRRERGLPVLDDAALFAVLDEEVAALAALDADCHALAREILVELRQLWPSGREGEPSLCHGSFSHERVLVDADGPVFLGLDAACLADRHLDVGSFLAGLTLAETFREIAATTPPILRAAFIRGCGVRLVPALRFEAVALLRNASRPFRALRPAWRAEMRTLVEAARARIG